MDQGALPDPPGRHVPIEETEVYTTFVSVADDVWRIVKRWIPFDRDTLGKQLVDAADGAPTNLVEGDGRFGDKESIQFFRIARASAREARHWIRRAVARGLIDEAAGNDLCCRINSGGRQLNGLIGYRRNRKKPTVVREEPAVYGTEDPLAVLDASDE